MQRSNSSTTTVTENAFTNTPYVFGQPTMLRPPVTRGNITSDERFEQNLIRAIDESILADVMALVNKTNVNTIKIYGHMSVLHKAARTKGDVFNYLLSIGANIDAKNDADENCFLRASHTNKNIIRNFENVNNTAKLHGLEKQLSIRDNNNAINLQKNNDLIASNNYFKKKNAEYAAGMEQVRAECSALKRKVSDIAQERDTIVNERNTLVQERDTITKKCAKLTARCDTAERATIKLNEDLRIVRAQLNVK